MQIPIISIDNKKLEQEIELLKNQLGFLTKLQKLHKPKQFPQSIALV